MMKKYPNNENIKKEFKTYKNPLHCLIKTAKSNYYTNKMNNNKALWNTVKEINNETSSANIIKEIKNSSGMIIKNDTEIANCFKSYFANVGENLAKNIQTPNSPKPEKKLLVIRFFQLTTKEEVLGIISSLKTNKAPGYDLVRAETLKNISEEIASPLTHLINNIMETGICPDAFKLAVVKPLFKSGDKLVVSNYRPISLITNVAKVFEKNLKKKNCQFHK